MQTNCYHDRLIDICYAFTYQARDSKKKRLANIIMASKLIKGDLALEPLLIDTKPQNSPALLTSNKLVVPLSRTALF